ncbi:DUF6191 domain-containing protein [Georgenia muralis]
MSEVFMIFEPGLRHLLEERERRRHEVQIPGSAAPPFGIDLDAGVAYLPTEEESSGESATAAASSPLAQARTATSSSSSSSGSTERRAE